MIIEEKDFRLIPVGDSIPRYDLELLYLIKGKNERWEFKNAAYGIDLISAIKRIAHYRVNCKHKEESIPLLLYLQELKEELELIKTKCLV